MSLRLFSPENSETLENLLTPVSSTNFKWASRLLITEQKLRKPSRMIRACSGVAKLSRIGLSYSSISTTTGWPAIWRRSRTNRARPMWAGASRQGRPWRSPLRRN